MKNTSKTIRNPEQFIINAAKLAGIKYDDVISKSRIKYHVDVRAMIVRILRDDWDMSYPSIGRFLNRDHASVMRLYKRKGRAEYQIPENPLKKVIKELHTAQST